MTQSDPKLTFGLLALPGRAPRLADRESGRDNNFNLIRLMAASGVLVSHAYPISLGEGTPEPLQKLLHGISLGTVCVYTFFAISGFFITRSFAQRGAAWPFVKARALRLVPALAVVVAATVLFLGPLVSEAPAGIYWRAVPGYSLHNLTLYFIRYDLPGVFVHNPYGPAINGSLWSLSYEVTCYLGVLVAGLLGLLQRSGRFALVLLGFAVFYALTMAADMNFRLEQLANLGLPFVLGMGFWVGRARLPLSLPLAGLLVGVAGIAWFTVLFTPAFTLALAYATFLLGYARIPGLSGQGPASLVRRNDYSYGMYVYAFPVQQLIALAGVTTPLLNILLALPATLAFAVLSWHLVEAPALRLRQPAAAAVKAAVVKEAG